MRVIVEPNAVSDEEARQLAHTIRQRIEEQLNYPGSIEITVIREQRYSETALSESISSYISPYLFLFRLQPILPFLLSL